MPFVNAICNFFPPSTMKTLSLALMGLSSLTLVTFATFARMWNPTLIRRIDSGTIESDVLRVQGGKHGEPSEIEKHKAKRNMAALRRMAVCVKTPKLCRQAPRKK
ncbi:MAG: hypothetical protein [Siphoviridae sp. ctpQM7]|nr:MAG: hypothetical protein [Siphoviridae sp. ctpQM7]